jgi:hypothetical protein
MANTILVVYTNRKELTVKEIGTLKKYAFNTDNSLPVGTRIESTDYDTNMMVVKVLPVEYRYFNSATGKLSNVFNCTTQWEIRDLVIRSNKDTAVYCTLID